MQLPSVDLYFSCVLETGSNLNSGWIIIFRFPIFHFFSFEISFRDFFVITLRFLRFLFIIGHLLVSSFWFGQFSAVYNSLASITCLLTLLLEILKMVDIVSKSLKISFSFLCLLLLAVRLLWFGNSLKLSWIYGSYSSVLQSFLFFLWEIVVWGSLNLLKPVDDEMFLQSFSISFLLCVKVLEISLEKISNWRLLLCKSFENLFICYLLSVGDLIFGQVFSC